MSTLGFYHLSCRPGHGHAQQGTGTIRALRHIGEMSLSPLVTPGLKPLPASSGRSVSKALDSPPWPQPTAGLPSVHGEKLSSPSLKTDPSTPQTRPEGILCSCGAIYLTFRAPVQVNHLPSCPQSLPHKWLKGGSLRGWVDQLGHYSPGTTLSGGRGGLEGGEAGRRDGSV